MLLEFRGFPSALGCQGPQEALEGPCFQDVPSSQPSLFHLVDRRVLGFLEILLVRVVRSHLDDLAFPVGQVLQEIQVYPNLKYQGLPLALFDLFCLVFLSVRLSPEAQVFLWGPRCSFLGVLSLQVVQDAPDLLVVHQAPRFQEVLGDLEVQEVQFLHILQGLLFLLANLALLLPLAWLVLVLPWLLGHLACQESPAFLFLQDNQVILLLLVNRGLP